MLRLAVIMAGLASPIGAQTLCDTLDTLDGAALELAHGTADCTDSLALGGARNIHCVLAYPYRSVDATRVFDALVDEVTACVGLGASIIQDQSVNHPDAYDLRTFEGGTRQYAVSIKDKGALQQTLVFVRVTRP